MKTPKLEVARIIYEAEDVSSKDKVRYLKIVKVLDENEMMDWIMETGKAKVAQGLFKRAGNFMTKHRRQFIKTAPGQVINKNKFKAGLAAGAVAGGTGSALMRKN